MRILRSPPPDLVVLIGMLVFVGLFLGTIFFALAWPAWRDVHAPLERVTGTIAALRTVRTSPVGYSIPSSGSKTTYLSRSRPSSLVSLL